MVLKKIPTFSEVQSWANAALSSHNQNEVHTSLQPPQIHGNESHSESFLSLSDFNTEHGYFTSGNGTRTIYLANNYVMGIPCVSHVQTGGNVDRTHGARATAVRPTVGEFDVKCEQDSSTLRVNWSWMGILE